MIKRASIAVLNVTLKLTSVALSGLLLGGSALINAVRGGRVL